MAKKMNITSEKDIHGILTELATRLFLEVYQDGENVVLLDNTVEGLSGDEWVTMDTPKEVLSLSNKLYQDRKLLTNATNCNRCFACERHWMKIPGARDSSRQELLDLAKRLLAEYEWSQGCVVSLCPNCCGNLKTDSDYYGLVYLS